MHALSHETLTLSPFSQLAGLALAGWLLWPFVEYGVHGVLSHRFRSFVTPLHGSHHLRRPDGVQRYPHLLPALSAHGR